MNIFLLKLDSPQYIPTQSHRSLITMAERGGDNSGDEGTHSSGASPCGAKAISGFIPGEFSPRSSLYFVRMCLFNSDVCFIVWGTSTGRVVDYVLR